MNFKKLRNALTLALLIAPVSLHATPINFTWTAIALPDSTLNGQAFSGDIVFTGISDTTLAKANPIVTGGQNFGIPSTGPVHFSIPSLNASGITPDTAFIIAIPIAGAFKFTLSPNGVNGDIGDLLISNAAQNDLFNASASVSGAQFVEALGTAPVSSALIGANSVSNTSLFLDTDPNQNATFVEAVGTPEPATWRILLGGGLVLLLVVRGRSCRSTL